jgi:hypothetical protein
MARFLFHGLNGRQDHSFFVGGQFAPIANIEKIPRHPSLPVQAGAPIPLAGSGPCTFPVSGQNPGRLQIGWAQIRHAESAIDKANRHAAALAVRSLG